MRDSGDGRRNKGKDKLREKKKHPYKSGGRFRSSSVKETKNSEDKKKGKKKKK